MRSILFPLAALALTSCGSDKSTQIYKDKDGNAVAVSSDDAGSNVKIKSKDGELTINSGANASTKLPYDLPMPDNTVVMSNAVAHTRDTTKAAMVAMKTKETPAEVVAFYKKAAEARGFKIESEVTANETRNLVAKKPNTGGFIVGATPGEGDEAAFTMVTMIAGTDM